MAPILTKDKVTEFLAAGNDIAIPILSLVKDASGAFPPLQLAATAALFIASNVKVSSVYPKRQSTFLLTVHKGFRESEKEWVEFNRYVTEMVGEIALQWDLISHSGPEQSLERWRKNIKELSRCISLFHSLRLNDADIQS